jgi:hypothetical protein
MPDISMCSGEKCPLKENCYRFLATPNEFRQSYFMNPPYDHQTKECDHFWDVNLYKKIKKEENETD